jgi:hypothetical protein
VSAVSTSTERRKGTKRTNLGMGHFECTADTVFNGPADLLLNKGGRKRAHRLVE